MTAIALFIGGPADGRTMDVDPANAPPDLFIARLKGDRRRLARGWDGALTDTREVIHERYRRLLLTAWASPSIPGTIKNPRYVLYVHDGLIEEDALWLLADHYTHRKVDGRGKAAHIGSEVNT